MSEKKGDSCRRVKEGKKLCSPVTDTLLDDQTSNDQVSIIDKDEKDCIQYSKDIPRVSPVAISEEEASKTDFTHDESSSSKTLIEPDTFPSNKEIFESLPSISIYDWTNKRVSSDETAKPIASKGSLFLREGLSTLSTVISDSDSISTSQIGERDITKEKCLKNIGYLSSGEGTSKSSTSQNQPLKIGGTVSSLAPTHDLGNSSNSSADEEELDKKRFVKDLGYFTPVSFLDSSEESDEDPKNDDSEVDDKRKRSLSDYHKTQRFYETPESLNKLMSENNLISVQKFTFSDSKIQNIIKFHEKEEIVISNSKLRRSLSAPPELHAARFSNKLLSHTTKSLAYSIERKTEGKVHDRPVSKEMGIVKNDKIQKDDFNKREICSIHLDHPQSSNISALIAEDTNLALKSKLDIQDINNPKNSENKSKPDDESIGDNSELSKIHLEETIFENKPSLENLETLPAVNIVAYDPKSKAMDITKHDYIKTKESDSIDEKKPVISDTIPEPSHEIFKIPVVRRPKKLPQVDSPNQSPSLFDTSKTVKVTPNNFKERPKDLRGKVRSAYYEFSPGSPSGFVMRPYRSLPNVHIPPRKTNQRQNFTADQIQTAVRALFTGHPDPQTPSYRQSPVIGEIKALLENLNVPDAGGNYNTSKKSRKSRPSGSISKSDFTKLKSCRKLTFDSPKREQSDVNPVFQGHSSSDVTGGISNLQRSDMVPSSLEEIGKTAVTLPEKELTEPSTSVVLSPTTQEVSAFDTETDESVDKFLDDLNVEESPKNVLPQDNIVNVTVSPSKRKAETLEYDSSATSFQVPGVSDESFSKRPAKKNKLSSELNRETEDNTIIDAVAEESLSDYLKPLTPDKKHDENLKDNVSPLKRKGENIDSGCSFTELEQSETQTSKRTKLQSETSL